MNYYNMERINNSKLFQLFVQNFWSVLLAVGAICSIIALLLSMFKIHWIFYILLILILSLVLISSLLLLKRENVPNILLDVVSISSTEDSEVLSSAIDRYFHLHGYHKERIELGHLLIDSKNIEIQVGNQIDRFGWANYKLGIVQPAIQYITNGVELANNNRLYYMAAKGERHLAGIERRRSKDAFIEHVEKSKKYTELIECINEKTEMEGSIHLLIAKHLLEQKENLLQAEKEANEAMKAFSNDPKRQLKVYYVLGQIHFERGEWDKAYKMFFEGYTKSEGVRDEERSRNAYELARIHAKKEAEGYFDLDKAKKYYDEAHSLINSLEQHKHKQKVHDILKIRNIFGGIKRTHT